HMATERMTIGSEPVQITDGTNSALISVFGGYPISFADSDVEPDKSVGDIIRDKMVVNPPLKVWLWSDGPGPHEVAVTRW
ncbi:TPA: hypothetical protein ACNH1J_002189, partial [Enterobacter hormaechei]